MVSGWYGLENIGRLEDPPFPIKQAFILTQYPGASALEVEQEISEKIELSLRELPWISRMESRSVPGHSEVEVELHRWVTAEQAPQIWDELRSNFDLIAYPYGGHNCMVRLCARLHGYQMGFTTAEKVYNPKTDNPMAIPRIELKM